MLRNVGALLTDARWTGISGIATLLSLVVAVVALAVTVVPAPSLFGQRPRMAIAPVAGAGEPAVHLSDLRSRATWTSGAGAIPFADNQERGILSHECEKLEDGGRHCGFLTHPSYVDGAPRFIRGCFDLPRPIAAADRFRTTIGFPHWVRAGAGTFRVDVQARRGTTTTTTTVAEKPDARTDGKLHQIDAPLAAHAGSQVVCLQVDAAGADDAAFWVDPRVERP
ncbi:hypothetical protein [Phytohabitans suffuscus]|uniref:Glycosyl hydrolase family 98 putative carbohydrate-binding module domain-containing protein n=1 Tax=Phytohabitans suffuscus TaxID=624315 RepID=A0A6F8YQD0_9ACTN|nr:hypothetical protein [Phytohabitans suffuscus]BCB88193.1 hypothetical protein Psuf_055060 [Phytohabitans suffuscus]